MKRLMIIAAILTLFSVGCGSNNSTRPIEVSTAGEAVLTLKEGNELYIDGKKDGATTQKLREDLTENGQHPYAVVITCSDSRVPVEEIFSCNAGEIFVVRTAGNVIDDLEMGSIEYGVEHCGAPLILVLGHTHCGAVTATVEGENEGNNIDEILHQIEPAVEEARKISDDEETIINEGVRINVMNGVAKIKADNTIQEKINSGNVEVKGAVYDIKNGTVEWLSQ